MNEPDPADGDAETPKASGAWRDGAAPHTAPFPAHVPRWVAWIVLAALVASGIVCVRAVVG